MNNTRGNKRRRCLNINFKLLQRILNSIYKYIKAAITARIFTFIFSEHRDVQLLKLSTHSCTLVRPSKTVDNVVP